MTSSLAELTIWIRGVWHFRHVIGFVILLMTFSGIQAQPQQQFPSDFWNQGKVVLDGGDTLKGLIKYNLQNDLVQLQFNGRLETYTPRKVVSFEIFDQTVRKYRVFYSLPYEGVTQYKTPVFFELMGEGKMTLLCRESLEYKTYSSSYYYGSYTRLILVNHYFLLKEDGSIRAFTGTKNDFFDLMGNYGDDVKKYARQNKISFDNKSGVIALVEYYNHIAK